MDTSQRSKIVVGFDGSFASRTALRWAISRAARDNATVTAVEVARQPRLVPGTSYAVQPYGMAPPIERMSRQSSLHEAILAARSVHRTASEVMELHVDGDPGVELARLAQGATMLVLGHTPRTRLTEFIVGSTASDCLRRTRCPIVLIPADVAG
jgi:nucleotide-binding universal stress UspA family protein